MSESAPAPGVLAFETLDCASKVRIHYRLSRRLEREWLSALPGQLEVQEFSRMARGARDHLTLIEPDRWHAGGVVGDAHMVVTYGKQNRERPVEAIARFEAELAQACGPIRLVGALKQVLEEGEAGPLAQPER